VLTPYGHGLISLIKSTPYPNAAGVFTTWLISREGRITSREVTANTRDARNSARINIQMIRFYPNCGFERELAISVRGPDSVRGRNEAIKLLNEILTKR